MSMVRRVGRSLGAAVAIVAVVAGVPVALWWLSSPRFAELLDGGSVVDVLLRPDDGTLLLSALALVAGVAWLILTVSILGELGAAVTRRPSPTIALPGFRFGGAVAAALVAALLGSSPAFAETRPATFAAAAATNADLSDPTASQPSPGPEYVVAARDSLWRIAEARLGDGLRWREIFDLNAGRPQADGGRLSDGAILTPGWVLVLPADASTSVTVEPGDTLRGIAAERLGDPDRAVEVFELNEGEPQSDGTSLTSPGRIRPGWTLHLPEPGRPAGSPASPGTAPPPPTVPPSADPPTTSPPGEAPPTTPPETTTIRPPASEPTGDTRAPSRPGDDPSSPFSSSVVTTIGLTTAVAAGVLTALALRRRRQLRHRPHGHRVAVPDDGAGRLEWTAQQHSPAGPTADRLDLALRSLVHPDLRPDPAPRLRWVERSVGTARIHLAEAASLPPPFEPSDVRPIWELDLDAALSIPDDEVAGFGSPFPTLVTLGVDGDRSLLVDLEQHRVLRIGGDRERVRALLRHLAAELATSTVAQDVETLLVDLGAEAEDFNPDRIVIEPDLAAAISELERRAITTRMELSRLNLASTIEGRLHYNSASSWLPTVLLVGEEPTPAENERIDELLDETTAGTTGVAVVVFDPTGLDLQIRDDGIRSVDLPADDSWRAVQLADDDSDQLADLLGTTDDPADPVGSADGDEPWSTGMNEDGSLDVAGADGDENTERTRDTESPPHGATADDSGGPPTVDPEALRRLAIVDHQDPRLDEDLNAWWADGPPAAPMIGILGEPVVRGAGPRPNTRPSWFAEVLVYLSLHPAGVTQAKAATDLWPDGHRISPATIRHAFYGARRWAGRGLGGDPAATFVSDLQNDNSYRLRGHLLDWDLFRRLRKRAQARHAAGHPGAASDYEAALNLIRGPVLGSLRPGGYAWLNNHDQRHDLQIPGFIVDTAHELVDLALATGNLDLARRAAERARMVDIDVAFDRPLTDLMRIAHAEDNQAELELYGSILLDARGFDVPEELAPESFTIINELLPSGPRRLRS